MSNETAQAPRSRIARLIRVLSVPIILFWLLLALGTTLFTPSLGEVAGKHSVPMTPMQAPAFKDMMNIGHKFQEFDTDSTAMVVLEGQDKLGDSAHVFYNKIVAKLKADRHVQNVQDFWSDPLTAAGSQSPDGKAAYVQVFLDGAQGTTPSHESVAEVRKIVNSVPAPPGVKAYVAGNTVLNTDTLIAAHNSMDLMTTVTIGVIFVMLLGIYRSLKNAFLALVLVRFELYAAEGVVATAGNLNIVGLTPYAVSMVTMLTIATGTDYFIFLLGRYHEARSRGEDREQAYYTAYHGVLHVILGSGLTIVGACLCLTATRLPYFQTMGFPCAIALVVTMLAGLTLAPALLAVASRFGFFDPKRAGFGAGLAQNRHPGDQVAEADHRRDIVYRGDWFRQPDDLCPKLQRQEVHPGGHRSERGPSGGRAAFLSGADESGIADGRSRSRHTQPGGHADHRQDRQERIPRARYRAGADDHPPARGAHRAQFAALRDRHE